MATEGQFTKIDGDILYASEVNAFNNNRLIDAGSGIWVTSGTDFQAVGSVLIPANTIGNPSRLNIIATIDSTNFTNVYGGWTISGLNGNTVAGFDTGVMDTPNRGFIGNALIGSNLTNMINCVMIRAGTSTTGILQTTNLIGSATSINPGSPIVVFFNIQFRGPAGGAGSATINNYVLTSNGLNS